MNSNTYEEEDDDDYSQYRFVKSRKPQKDNKKKVQKLRWDDDYGYYEKR